MTGVIVKPLAWSPVEDLCTRETAPALGGTYNIVMLDGDEGPPSLNLDLGGWLNFRFILEPDPHGLPGDRRPRQFGSVAEAKAFAQADYEARILSAIDTTAIDAQLAALRAEVGRLRVAFRVNMLRLAPGTPHSEIDRIVAECAALSPKPEGE